MTTRVRYLALAVLLGTEFIYLVVFLISFFRVDRSRGVQEDKSLYQFLAALRLILSKVLFLPIFHMLSYPFSCSYQERAGNYTSSLSEDLPCLLSDYSNLRMVELNLLVITTVLACFHLGIALFSESFDFEVSFNRKTNSVK